MVIAGSNKVQIRPQALSTPRATFIYSGRTVGDCVKGKMLARNGSIRLYTLMAYQIRLKGGKKIQSLAQ